MPWQTEDKLIIGSKDEKNRYYKQNKKYPRMEN
jgi:hypothetical protein